MEIGLGEKQTFVFGVILILGLTGSPPISAGPLELDDLDLSCSGVGVTTALKLLKNADQFWKNIDGSVSTIRDMEMNGKPVIEPRVLCCQVNQLQARVLEEIGKKCGSNIEENAKVIVNGILNTREIYNNKLSDLMSCDWTAWYYRKESPQCWSMEPKWSITLMGISLVAILSFVFACVKVIWSKYRRSQSKTVQAITTENDGFLRRNSI